MAILMTVQKVDSSPRNNKASVPSPVSVTGQGSSESVALSAIHKNSTPTPPTKINSAPPKPQASSLESWTQAYDSKKASKNKGTLNLTSAFKRPTYTAAPLKHASTSTCQNSASAAPTPTLEYGTTSPLKPIDASAATSKSDIVSEIEALIAECRKPPRTETPPTNKMTNPIDQSWTATSNFTLKGLDHSLHRLCSELNWDWYSEKYRTLNPNSPPALWKIWKSVVASIYEQYCIESAMPERTVWEMLIVVEGGEVNALWGFRRQLHNVMMFWSDVEGLANEQGVIEVVKMEEKDKLEKFAKALLSEGDILKFVTEKARSVGLDYPGGTGTGRRTFENRVDGIVDGYEKHGEEQKQGDDSKDGNKGKGKVHDGK